MSQSKDTSSLPSSMRQKRVLDVADQNPDASVEDLAALVPSVTPDLVEQVLDEYGDPAEGQSVASDVSTNSAMDTEVPKADDLATRQLETLRTIRENPEASQRDLGKIMGLAGSTISNRVHSIDGFEWENRVEFARSVLSDDVDPEPTETDRNGPQNGRDLEERIDNLEHIVKERTKKLERNIQTRGDADETTKSALDPSITHKILHACLKSDHISEEEELRIMKGLLHRP